ncbi:MAG: hypothetical protein Roseis2KO_32250 [Roseivirga sp.]
MKLSAHKPNRTFFTGLAEGDIMFVAYNGDGDDGFAIVALVDIPPNSTIYFNDNEWNGSGIGGGGAFDGTSEGEMTWSTGASVITAGTVVTFDEVDNSSNTNFGASVGTLTGSTLLGSSNEVIYAFVGTDDSTPTTFLSAIANDEFNVSNGQLANTGLTAGVDAVNIDGDEDVMVYTGSTVCNGTQAQCAAQIANITNWTTQDGTGNQDQDSTVPDFPDDVPASFTGSVFVSATPVGISITATTDVLCNGESTGSVTATVTPGEANYSYVWSTGASSGSTSSTTHSINSLPAGTYTVTVTDNNNTTATASTTISQPAAALIANASVASNVSCNGLTDGGVTVSATGGTTPYTYSWNTGATSASPSGLSANTYTVTVTDANGCTDTQTATITQPTTLVANASVASNVSCNGLTDGVVTASPTGGTSPYTYQWNTGATNASASGLAASTYTVTVIDANGCTDAQTATVTQPTTLVANASVASNVSCNGLTDGVVTASPTGGTSPYTYQWNTGATNASASGLAASTYTVTVIDANGCTDAQTATITEPTAIGASITAQTNIDCNGASTGSATATGSGGTIPYTFSWNTGSTLASLNGVTAGTYTVSITDANGCGPETAEVTITQPTALSAGSIVDQNVSINGGSDGGATASSTGGTSPYTYSWNIGATNASITGAAAGTYTVSVTDANGCGPATSQVTITEPTAVVASSSVDNNVSCNAGSDGGATVSASGGTSPYTYTWSNGATNASITGSVAGTYTVTVTDNNGATATSESTITQPTALSAGSVVDQNVSVNGGSDGGATASSTGGTTPYTYSWNTGATTAAITGLTAGTYTVSVTDANGCGPATSQVTITEPTAVVASSSVDSNVSCNGGSDGGATVSASGGISPYTYTWSNGATNASIAGSVAGTYTVTVTDNNGATATSESTITQPTALSAGSVVDSNVSVNGGSDGGATASASGGTSPYTYSWSNGATNASITGAVAGTYTVSVTDNNGCGPATSQVTITEPVNSAPVFTSATTADFVENGTGIAYTATTTDIESNAIAYSLGTGNDEALFDMAAGVVTFKTAPDFENPTDGDANNTYVINVIASDGINSVNQDVTITVTDIIEDMTPPDKPVITGISDDTGSSSSDGITSDRRIIVSGTSEANATVKVFRGTQIVGIVQADGSGNWDFDLTRVSLRDGTYSATVTARDAAGNTSVLSDPFDIVIDGTAPAKPVITGISDDTGSSSSDGITSDRRIIVSGTSEADATIKVFRGIHTIGTVQADGSGNWDFDLTGLSLRDGTYSATVTARDAAGNTSVLSDPFDIVIDGTAPAKPVITGISDDTGSSSSDGITSDRRIIVSGTSEGDATIELFRGSNSFGTVQADGSGNWDFDLTGLALPNGNYSATVTASDAAGNISDLSQVFNIVVDGTRPEVVIGVSNVSSTTYEVTASFDENVSGLTLAEISVTGGVASNLVEVSADVYTFEVSLSDVTADVKIDANTVQDLAGNNNRVSNQLTLGLPSRASREDFTNLTSLTKTEVISLYPNPVSKVMTIDLSELSAEAVDVYLYDAAGSPMFTRKAFKEKILKLDVSDYTSGMYILQCYDGQQVIRKKVVVKK